MAAANGFTKDDMAEPSNKVETEGMRTFGHEPQGQGRRAEDRSTLSGLGGLR
jgi:hypothetical protein